LDERRDEMKFVIALVVAVVLSFVLQPVVGWILSAGTHAHIFSLNEQELAMGKKIFSYVLAALVFFGILRA
jgi:phosphotransferase system  glucose/maltose/N-acetylglucosamine-specific IIC component